MSEKTNPPDREGIGLEYDPNDRVLRITLILPDGDTKTVSLDREKAVLFYRSLGEMLSPEADA